MKTKTNWKEMTIRTGLIAALYCGSTVAIAPLAYGPFSVRASSILLIFPFIFGLSGFLGIMLGGILANFFSPYGIADVLIGAVADGLFCDGLIYYFGVIARRQNREQPWLTLALLTSPLVATPLFIGYFLLYLVYQVPLIPMIPAMVVSELLTSTLGGWLAYKGIKRLLKGNKSYDFPGQ